MPGVMTPMVMLIMGLVGPALASTIMCTRRARRGGRTPQPCGRSPGADEASGYEGTIERGITCRNG